ncbi:MAG: lantibiotic dehydratase C-terminal domain-containing protein, partial [Pseudonocardiaceae bacterium]
MKDEAGWHNIGVYYYDDQRRDDLVLDCVRPLFASLAPRPSFFVRHWLRGPHLRLRFHTTAGDFDRVVISAIADQVGGWLAAHPSTVCVDEAKLLETHERLAKAECETGPLSPFYPDNSIQYLPCDRRIDVLGSEATASLLEDFYVATTDLTFAMI